MDLAGIHNNYLTELVIKQKGNRVEGIFGYYFRDKYQSFFVHGTYNPRTREVTILNIPVIYFNSNSTVNSIDCNTDFRGVLINSKVGSSLKGYFYHDEKYKYTCPDLKVNYALDKEEHKQDSILDIAKASDRIWKPQADDHIVDVVATDKAASDDIAPAVSAPAKETVASNAPVKDSVAAAVNVPATTAAATVAPVAVNTPPPANTTPSATSPHKDSATAASDPAMTATTQTAVRDSTAQHNASAKASDSLQTSVVSTLPAPSMPVTATAATAPVPVTAPVTAPAGTPAVNLAGSSVVKPAPVLPVEETRKITESFTKRKPVLNQVLEVESDSVRVSFYDNGEIDGDSITVFINKHPVLSHQELAAKALTLYLLLDSTKEVNEISMFAENLGKYPPNTALMVVTDGKNRYEVFMSSSLTENATIQLKKKKKAAPNTGPGRRLSF